MITGRFYYHAYGTIGVVCQEDHNYAHYPRCLELAGRIRGTRSFNNGFRALEITSCLKENQDTVIAYLQETRATKRRNDFPKKSFSFRSRDLNDNTSYMPSIQFFDISLIKEIRSLEELCSYLDKIPFLLDYHREATIEFFLRLHPEFEVIQAPKLHL